MKSNRAMMISACIAVAVATLPSSAFAQTQPLQIVPTLGPNGQEAFQYLDTDNKNTPQPTTNADGTPVITIAVKPIEDSPPTQVAPTSTPAPAPAPAPTISPYAAESGPLTLMNCSGGAIKVKTYNSNDTVLWVAFQEKAIAIGSSSGLKCATSNCKLKVNSGAATPAMSGFRVYIGGAVKPTNKATMAKGCAAYAPAG